MTAIRFDGTSGGARQEVATVRETGGVPAVNDRFLRACRRQPVDRPPLWIMRQAGRYLPEYRALRERASFLALCRTPELAVEASLQPLTRFPLDAAIVFSDILVPLAAAGIEMSFDPGPRIATPIRGRSDVDALATPPMAEAAPYVGEAIALLRRELGGRLPVLGFAGAPWTLAAYLIEGRGGQGTPAAAQAMLHQDPETLDRLLGKLADMVADHLDFQLRSGADAVQIFDSWAGVLSPADYRRTALPAVRRIVEKLPAARGPVIYFAPASPHLLEDAATTGADVIGLCWRTSLAEARSRLNDQVALQGNLDPHALLGPPASVRARALEVLESGRGPGHVMNLGHGILPGTPIASVETLVETVTSFRPAKPAPCVCERRRWCASCDGEDILEAVPVVEPKSGALGAATATRTGGPR
jgi:uroporphyrinogen decarboxylase